jgi:hypothetical protein
MMYAVAPGLKLRTLVVSPVAFVTVVYVEGFVARPVMISIATPIASPSVQ